MTEPLPNIIDLTLSELKSAIGAMGEPAYRALQIHQWLFSRHATSFDEMSTLSLALRKKLSETLSIRPLEVMDYQENREEGCEQKTEKLLLKLPDGELVESVLITASERMTACVSSQAGCPLQCTFCATGSMGLQRNLTAGEIIGQVYALNQGVAGKTPGGKVTNVVFMGMGEPLLNTDNVLEAIETLTNASYSFSLPQKKISVSTIGIIPEIRRLAESPLKIKLAVSLHSAEQQKRELLMPLAARLYPLKDLKKALIEYTTKTGRPVTLVYMLLKGVNDSPEDARLLARFARSFLCKINLIDYNSINNVKFKPVSCAARELFQRSLLDAGLHVTVRKSYGTPINAACGQLATTGNQNRNNL